MHHAPPPEERLEDWEEELALRAATAFVARQGATATLDADDLQWIGLAHWLQVRRTFDPRGTAGVTTYMWSVLTNRFRDEAARERTLKRGRRATTLSLDALADHRPATDAGRGTEGEAMTSELARAVDRFRRRLPPRDRVILDALDESDSKREAALLLGMAPATLYDRLRQIARIAEAEGLREYL